jgi:hypothetical protein
LLPDEYPDKGSNLLGPRKVTYLVLKVFMGHPLIGIMPVIKDQITALRRHNA